MTDLLVRLKPYDPRRGHVLRRYSFRGILFSAARGWFRVTEEVAEHLRGVHQRDHNPHSPLAFDVATEDEAKAIDQRDAADKELHTPAEAAPAVQAREDRAPSGSSRSRASRRRSSRGSNAKAGE